MDINSNIKKSTSTTHRQTQHIEISVKVIPYDYSVRVIVTEDIDAAKRFVLKKIGDQFEDNEFRDGYAFTYCYEHYSPIIWLKKAPHKPSEWGTFVHEVDHACKFIAKEVGMVAEEISGESFSYTLGYVTEKILEKLQKVKKVKSEVRANTQQ